MSNDRHIELGKLGEDIAADFLKKNGYSIVARNIRFSRYELDIVAEDDNYLVFVEVKTRSCLYPESGVYGTPGSAVNSKKRTDTIKAANDYINKNHTSKQPRIDVIEIYMKESSNGLYPQILNINHIRNAFDSKGRKH